MLQTIELEAYACAVRAGRVEQTDLGYLLTGAEVAVLHPFGKAPFYRQGFHSWSLSGWLPGNLNLPAPVRQDIWPQLDHPVLLAEYPRSSSGVGALEGPDGNVLLLGALDLDCVVQADDNTLQGRSLHPNTGAENTWLLAYGPEAQVFASYARLLAGRRGVRGQGKAPRVWCSWYSLYTNIEENLLHATLEGVRGLPFEVFQLDDGWQISMGDWTPNEKFPRGMADLAQRIRQAGFTAGLWLAPLIVQPHSRLFREHPDWLVRDAAGQPVQAGHNWGAPFYGLDTTHPEAQAWLRELITTVRGWGYDYLKLDFLYAAALPGRRYSDVPGEAAFRQGFEIMRQAADAAGGAPYILACGVPVLACLGLADGLRIGPDVAPFWDNTDRSAGLHDLTGPSTLNAIRTSLGRLWLRPLVQIDPDVAFFRTRYNLLNPMEKAVLQDLVRVTGFKATSDLPQWLDPEERAQLAAFMEEDAQVQALERYNFQIDGRPVSFKFVEDAWPV